jgi:hypothetical protein
MQQGGGAGAIADRRQRVVDAVIRTSALMFVALLCVNEAQAGEHRYAIGDPAYPAYPAYQAYQAECGSCHVAYPPALMSAAAWTAVFGRLDRHFGVDASLDPATTRRLLDVVTGHAARKGRNAAGAGSDLPRISTSRWFLKEHREVTAEGTAHGAASMSDCRACHTQAARGDFSESTLRFVRRH